MQPWYKVTTLREEVREGRSFNPDEFAIALEQVVAGTAPPDYNNPKQFFDRTCFTNALTEHLGIVLRRLAGVTQNTPPVLSLVTQFGGGKTHTLTALYHLLTNPKESATHSEVQHLFKSVGGASKIEGARVAVFVGNAWDPGEGRETPWIDMARQLAGPAGVEALGPKALTSPPGTESINRLIQVAGGRVLFLFDEVLNYFNRHPDMGDGFYAFLDNSVRTMTGAKGSAAMLSLPRSMVEMTDKDQLWLDRIEKIVHRVSKDLIANDEAEISEVVRRRLFEDIGKESMRREVAKIYGDWCFERRAQLPPEWTAVDVATTDANARDHLMSRFEASYPFHPATITVFQRKWQGLSHYQRTRGTLAMLAQWISWAAEEGFKKARTEPLITLGSTPLGVSDFRATILGQLGEQRLDAAIEWDIAGKNSHSSALDADTKKMGAPLKEIHRRVASVIFFESSGAMADKVAHLPEIRFALGEPDLDVASIDNAVFALEKRAYYIKRVGSDGFKIGYKATLRKVVGDRRAGLDEHEVSETVVKAVRREFEKRAEIPWYPFPKEGSEVPDSPKLTLVVMDPDSDWDETAALRKKVSEWTRKRGKSNRLYPAALVWLFRKPGRGMREKAELLLAWKRVEEDLRKGMLGDEFDRNDRGEVAGRVREAEEILRDEIWASYRFAILMDSKEQDNLRVIDLGAGHSSASGTLATRVVDALKAEGLLNLSVGVGYIDRNWPIAHKTTGAWPLKGLRQCFLDGSLTRLMDPEEILKKQIATFVERGDFGLGSDMRKDGSFERLWWAEPIGPEEISFDEKTFLVRRERVEELQSPRGAGTESSTAEQPTLVDDMPAPPKPDVVSDRPEETYKLTLQGDIPPEQWNKVGRKLIPKLRSLGSDLELNIGSSLTVASGDLSHVVRELRQAIKDAGLEDKVKVDWT